MGTIKLNNIHLYAKHGCLDEEGKIGSMYSVDLSVKADFTRASETDQLKDAVDYVQLNSIVKEEMSIRSALLEHVARRIIDRCLEEVPMIQKVKVKLSKINPPIGGNVSDVSVIMRKKQKKR